MALAPCNSVTFTLQYSYLARHERHVVVDAWRVTTADHASWKADTGLRNFAMPRKATKEPCVCRKRRTHNDAVTNRLKLELDLVLAVAFRLLLQLCVDRYTPLFLQQKTSGRQLE